MTQPKIWYYTTYLLIHVLSFAGKDRHCKMHVATFMPPDFMFALEAWPGIVMACAPLFNVHHRCTPNQEQLPAYLKSLPLPNTLGGFASLTRDQWIELLPFILLLLILLYLIISPLLSYFTTSKQRRPRINKSYKPNAEKVSNSFLLRDVTADVTKEGYVSFCRCWKSATVRHFCVYNVCVHRYLLDCVCVCVCVCVCYGV